MLTIRPFVKSDAEYEALCALDNAVWPEFPVTVEQWVHGDDTRDPQYLYRRVVAELDGRVVGNAYYCEPAWSYRPNKYRLGAQVHPDFRRQGIGGALYDHVMAALTPLGPNLLTAGTRESQQAGVRFLTQRGFRVVQRNPISHLDVTRFDHAKFAEIPAQVEALGVQIKSLDEIATEDLDWQRKLWQLEWELVQDVPLPDQITEIPFEVFVERHIQSPTFNRASNFIALDGGRWVGLSALQLSPADPEKLNTGLTGVVRSHRRKKIATALKVRAIAYARQAGVRLIDTDNEENNPMFYLNLQLGFEPQPAWLEFEKQLAESPGAE